jgi:hypothetical protein
MEGYKVAGLYSVRKRIRPGQYTIHYRVQQPTKPPSVFTFLSKPQILLTYRLMALYYLEFFK